MTQATISDTICRAGCAAWLRPPEKAIALMKRRQLSREGVAAGSEDAYEEEHLIPLELGGAAADERNLWPQPRQPLDGWHASRKDELEGVLRKEVCAGRLPLAEAQRAIASDWHGAWLRLARGRPERAGHPQSPDFLHGDGHYNARTVPIRSTTISFPSAIGPA